MYTVRQLAILGLVVFAVAKPIVVCARTFLPVRTNQARLVAMSLKRRAKTKSQPHMKVKPGALVSRGGHYYRIVGRMSVMVTGYDANCSTCDTGSHTSYGKSALHCGAATDPRVIPKGLFVLVSIPRYGDLWPVDDKGGAIKKRRLDLRFKTHKEAVRFGRKRMTIVIMRRT